MLTYFFFSNQVVYFQSAVVITCRTQNPTHLFSALLALMMDFGVLVFGILLAVLLGKMNIRVLAGQRLIQSYSILFCSVLLYSTIHLFLFGVPHLWN